MLSFAVLPLTYRGLKILGTLLIHKIGEHTRFTEDAERILRNIMPLKLRLRFITYSTGLTSNL